MTEKKIFDAVVGYAYSKLVSDSPVPQEQKNVIFTKIEAVDVEEAYRIALAVCKALMKSVDNDPLILGIYPIMMVNGVEEGERLVLLRINEELKRSHDNPYEMVINTNTSKFTINYHILELLDLGGPFVSIRKED